MKNTKLKAIFDISEEINTISSNYSDFLDGITSNTIQDLIDSNGGITLTGRSGLSYNFVMEIDDRFMDCNIIGKDTNETIVYDLSSPIKNWEEATDGQIYTFQDVIADINDQFLLQNEYGSLASHLTTSVKIDSAHLDTIVTDMEFRDLLVDYCKDGSLSQSGFLSALQQMYEATKTVCENEGAIDIDDSRPGYLRGIGAIFSTLISTLSQIVSTVVALFSRILGFIFITISSLLQAIFNRAVESETFTYDLESDTDYINYPVCAKYNEDLEMDTHKVLEVDEIGALDVYLYRRANGNYDINAFLSLRYHVGRTISFLHNNLEWIPTVSRDPGNSDILEVTSASSNKLLNLPDTCYLSMDEKYDLLSNEQELLNTIAFNLIISFGAIFSHYLNITENDTIKYVSLSPNQLLDCSVFNDNVICAQFFDLCYLISSGQPNLYNTTWTFVFDYITYLRDVVLNNTSFNDDGNIFRSNGSIATFTCGLSEPVLNTDTGYYGSVNNIPSSRFINLPQIEPGTLKTTAILTAIATTVTFITATAFSRKMNKIRARRAVRRSGELSNLKREYEANPSLENETAYVNAILKQNRRAKIFGGSVYDPSNGWFETSNTSSTITLPILNNIKKLIKG